MDFSRREGPFVAEINGGMLSARRYVAESDAGMNDAHFLSNAASAPLFVLPVAGMPWLVMHGDGLYAQPGQDALAPLYRGGDAAQLLRCITDLLTTVEAERLCRRKFRKSVYGLLAGALLVVAFTLFSLFSAPSPHMLPTVDARPVFHPETGAARYSPAEPDAPPLMPARAEYDRTDRLLLQQPPSQPQQPTVAAPADGWALPLSARAALPAKLRNAASRGLFTVPLSSGHARTIYVFADPACPNCQRMARHFESVAGAVNVVIFPVTIEGREASLKALTPVMALPEAERPAAWRRLFAADAGIGVPGGAPTAPAVTDETRAETARGAIGVNEVAFRAYRLPGTPWTISDDGRYVPQSVLSSPGALTDFLNGGGDDRQ